MTTTAYALRRRQTRRAPITSGPKRVALYLRISEDPLHLAAGVSRQLEDTIEEAKRRGWTGEPYIDNDVSAYKRNVTRPEFERMLVNLASGAIDGAVIYNLDRLARQPADLERLITIYENNESLVFAGCGSDLDLHTEDGQFHARLMVNIANKSSADTARRVARSHLDRARKGIPTSTRAYGWLDDKVTLDPVESAHLRQAAQDVIAGLSLTGIVRKWNEQGITTRTGKRWLKQTLKVVLLSPRMAGYRVHQGEAAVTVSGELVIGTHQPILTVEEWETVCAIIADPARSITDHGGSRKYLLAGLLRCGRCSQRMVGNARVGASSHFYTCKEGCGHNNINGTKIDALVAKMYKEHMAVHQDDQPVIEGAWPGEEELRGIEFKISELMDEYMADKTQRKGKRIFQLIDKLEERADQLNAEKKAQRRTDRSTVAISTRKDWDQMTTDERRADLEDALQAIAVRPGTPGPGGRAPFDPERIDPVWRHDEPATAATALVPLPVA